MDKLKEVLAKYQTHPEFLGLDLTRADQCGAMDDTPLHIAARKGELDDIAVLVRHGADVNLRGDLGHTPLHYAAMSAQAAAVERLLDLGADTSLKNEFSETPLQVAEVGGPTEIANILRTHRPRRGE